MHDFKAYYESIAIKILWYLQRNKQIDGSEQIIEEKSCTNMANWLWQRCKDESVRLRGVLKNGVGIIRHPNMKIYILIHITYQLTIDHRSKYKA